ncbi:MAG: hypothetical protein HZC48_06165 [Nitrospirae bacterium]|nr:hypothetical protein [Nitrospirota bacterium]
MKTLLNNILKITVNIFIAVQILVNLEAFAVEPAVFKGRILDVEGKAVKGAEVFIYSAADTKRPADFISALTDSEGRFNMTIPTGKYWAIARLRKGAKYGPLSAGDKHSGEPAEIELKDDREFTMDFTVTDIMEAAHLFRKTRENYMKVSGRIVDKQGTPVKMFYMLAMKNKEGNTPLTTLNIEEEGSTLGNRFPDFISAWTDEEGRYALYLPKGKYYIGYSDKFPSAQYHAYNDLAIDSEKENFDIVIDNFSVIPVLKAPTVGEGGYPEIN